MQITQILKTLRFVVISYLKFLIFDKIQLKLNKIPKYPKIEQISCKILGHEVKICFAMETTHLEGGAKNSIPPVLKHQKISRYQKG